MKALQPFLLYHSLFNHRKCILIAQLWYTRCLLAWITRRLVSKLSHPENLYTLARLPYQHFRLSLWQSVVSTLTPSAQSSQPFPLHNPMEWKNLRTSITMLSKRIAQPAQKLCFSPYTSIIGRWHYHNRLARCTSVPLKYSTDCMSSYYILRTWTIKSVRACF